MEVTEGLIESDCSDYARERDLMSPLKFDILFQEYKSAVYGFAYYLTQNQGEAEDLFQETWLRVVKYLPENMNMHGFKAWVFTVTANLHRDALRKKRVRRFFIWQKSKDLANTSGLSPFMLEGDRPDNSHEMDRVELSMAISRAVANLPSRQRLVFVLKEIEGFKINKTWRKMRIV